MGRYRAWRTAFAVVLVVGLLTACNLNGSLGPTPSVTTPAESPSVKGTVTYKGKQALPPNARVEISLQDVSSPDIGPVSSTSIATMGRQPPFSWEIPFDRASLDPSGAYVVTARIFVASKVAYRTASPVAVITNGGPTTGVHLAVTPA